MITIKLVKVAGRLVGQTVSDRWNLMQFGIATVAYDRNQAAVKKLRRALASHGFTLSVVRNESVIPLPSPAEQDAMGKVWSCPPQGRHFHLNAA